MKKAFMTALLLTMVMVCQAQEKKDGMRYMGEIEAVAGFMSGPEDCESYVGANFINSLRVNPYISVGLGVGLQFFTGNEHNNMHSLPVFMRVKGYIPMSESWSLYAGMDAGAAVLMPEVGDSDTGMYLSPSAGVRWNMGEKTGLNMGIAYQIQSTNDRYGNVGGFGLRVGFTF